LGEQVTRRLWLGLFVGFIGVMAVIWDRFAVTGAGILHGLAFAAMCLFGITVGTIYQRKYCSRIDPVSGTAVQYIVCAPAVFAAAALTETMRVDWTAELIASVVWMGAGLSAGTFLIFLWLLKRQGAARVSGLFYLVSPLTALLGWLLFGEVLGALTVAGMLVAVAGVAWGRRQ
jgi:drug/metabolite transporter (DMT)-like permease